MAMGHGGTVHNKSLNMNALAIEQVTVIVTHLRPMLRIRTLQACRDLSIPILHSTAGQPINWDCDQHVSTGWNV